jgi:hypothetical protein
MVNNKKPEVFTSGLKYKIARMELIIPAANHSKPYQACLY